MFLRVTNVACLTRLQDKANMLFTIGNKVYEVTWSHISTGLFLILLVLLGIFFVNDHNSQSVHASSKSPDVEAPAKDVEEEEETVEGCDFHGRGREATLMPSGNYYCRSTEKLKRIEVDGVEKVCCVVPR